MFEQTWIDVSWQCHLITISAHLTLVQSQSDLWGMVGGFSGDNGA